MNDDILDGREIPAEEQEELKEKIIDVDADKLKFYEDLRQKAKGWTNSKGGAWGGKLGEYLFLLPDFFILVARLALDKRVPSKQKLMAGGIVAYLIMPIDLIPDFIPVIGHVDDLVLVVLGLNMILNDIDAKVLADNWSGEGEVLEQMKKVTAAAERFLDKNLLQRIKGWLKHKI
jgi:uncharacterized membrane protein YkvA (DUF1232 family)